MSKKGRLWNSACVCIAAVAVLQQSVLPLYAKERPSYVDKQKEQKVAEASKLGGGNQLTLWYDEPADAGFGEIFASKYSFEWIQDEHGNWIDIGDGWLELGRGDAQNYTDGVNHSKSSTGPDGTWDVTGAVKDGVAWAKHGLPIGNGRMGAMSFGFTGTELVQMNEETLWTGGPGCEDNLAENAVNDADVYGNKNIADPEGNMNSLIDSAFTEYYASLESGDVPSDGLATPFSANNKNGNGVTPATREQEGSYQSFCEMLLDFNHEDVTDYARSLNLDTAISRVSYTYNNVDYQRDMFASYPDNVIVYKVSATENGKVSFTLHPEIPQKEAGQGRYNATYTEGTNRYGKEGSVVAQDDTITMSGSLKHNGMKFAGKFKVVADGGTMDAANDENYALASNPKDNGSITVTGANEAYIIVSLATDYVSDFDKDYSTGETLAQLCDRVGGVVDTAAAKGYDKLLADHEADYQELFDRVSLDIGGTFPDSTPTDELMKTYRATYKSDDADKDYNKYLETLYYQYGRYLLIASSREGSLPANLQGVWNDSDAPAWWSDYHTNINVQMNYWLAESTNLAETATALVDYANALRKPGRLSLAKTYGIGYDEDASKIDLDTEDGFVFFCNTTARGFTGNINSTASFTQTATAFLGQNLYDYYAFTKDKEYLRDNIYPYLREASLTYLQTLEPGRTESDKEQLFVAPSFSSEQGPWTVGTYFDQQLVWQLFHDTIQAMEDLGIEEVEITAQDGDTSYLENDGKLLYALRDAIERLNPVEIGNAGQIKEWQQEYNYVRTKNGSSLTGAQGDAHRHISSLAALYPGNYITKDDKELIEAAKVVLTNRTDTSTGWGLAHRLNLWARTGDGNHSYRLVNSLIGTCTYDNLFDTHAPFQIDGNFGGTAGITEMLIQSQDGKVELLPALPDAWASGSYEGLVARGNFEVDVQWTDKKAQRVKVTSNAGETLVLSGIDAKNVTDAEGNNVAYTKDAGGNYVVDTEKGETYVFTVEAYAEPTEPSKPTESDKPTEPAEPTEPSKPTESDKPTEPVVPTEPGKPTEPSPTDIPGDEKFEQGDVNKDAKVNLTDVRLVLRAVLKIDELDEDAFALADMDGDENVDLGDAYAILKKALHVDVAGAS